MILLLNTNVSGFRQSPTTKISTAFFPHNSSTTVPTFAETEDSVLLAPMSSEDCDYSQLREPTTFISTFTNVSILKNALFSTSLASLATRYVISHLLKLVLCSAHFMGTQRDSASAPCMCSTECSREQARFVASGGFLDVDSLIENLHMPVLGMILR